MVDQEKVEAAIKLLLEGIGEDPTREGLLETPARVARMYGEIAGGMDQSAEEHLSKTFALSLLARLRFMPAVCSCRSSCVRRLPTPSWIISLPRERLCSWKLSICA